MNKYFYRVVFNRVRGMLMVVSEITKNHQGNARSSQKVKSVHKLSNKAFTLKPMVFMSYLALGLVSVITPSYAGTIIVDKNAENHQRPIIAQTDKGATQVNIAAPNKNGVSHNKYNQFDVDKNGVILNNTKLDSRSRLGGNIKGNALLQETGSAKIILNEVNSKDPSKLNGYIEVAGKKAQVIIANPAGITCDGCGFINADRATLTTGKALFENDQLVGYRVEGGNITITGDGLDSSAQDYTDIIARSVNVNAELWASDLKVITGLNEVTVDGSVTKSDQTSGAPEFAIDVSALGGMYAGKIELIGTESGVGVHNAGQLGVSAGGLTITADGKIVNSGKIKVEKDIVINSNKEIENTNFIDTQQNIHMRSTSIKNAGSLTAKNDIALEAETITNSKGNIISNNELTLNAREIINQRSTIKANNVRIRSENISNEDTRIDVNKDLILDAAQEIRNQQSKIFAKHIRFDSGNIYNRDTNIHAEGDLFLRGHNSINNRDSSLYGYNVTFGSDSITNTNSTLDGVLSLFGRARDVNNNNSWIRAAKIDIDSWRMTNIATNFDGGEISLFADHLYNKDSSISAVYIFMRGQQIFNINSLLSGRNMLGILGKNIVNTSSKMESIKGSITIIGERIDNRNAVIEAYDNVLLAGGDGNDNIGALENLNNEHANISAHHQIYFDSTGSVNNRFAILSSDHGLIINAVNLDNSYANIYGNAGEHRLQADYINNTSAKILVENLYINAKVINNDNSSLTARGMHIKADKLVGNGYLKSYNDLLLDLQSSFINQSEIEAGGELTISTLGNIENYGRIEARNLTLSGLTITNDKNAKLNANAINIVGGSLNNYGNIRGEMIDIQLAKALNNYENGQLGGIKVNIKADEVNNFAASEYKEYRPTLFAEDYLNIEATKVNNYQDALIHSNNILKIKAKTLNNYYGVILGQNETSLIVDEFNDYVR